MLARQMSRTDDGPGPGERRHTDDEVIAFMRPTSRICKRNEEFFDAKETWERTSHIAALDMREQIL